MLCTKHIIIFSLGNYTQPENIIGKQFPQKKTIIEWY